MIHFAFSNAPYPSPGSLLVGNAFLQLELHKGKDLERDRGVDERLAAVHTLVPPYSKVPAFIFGISFVIIISNKEKHKG